MFLCSVATSSGLDRPPGAVDRNRAGDVTSRGSLAGRWQRTGASEARLHPGHRGGPGEGHKELKEVKEHKELKVQRVQLHTDQVFKDLLKDQFKMSNFSF